MAEWRRWRRYTRCVSAMNSFAEIFVDDMRYRASIGNVLGEKSSRNIADELDMWYFFTRIDRWLLCNSGLLHCLMNWSYFSFYIYRRSLESANFQNSNEIPQQWRSGPMEKFKNFSFFGNSRSSRFWRHFCDDVSTLRQWENFKLIGNISWLKNFFAVNTIFFDDNTKSSARLVWIFFSKKVGSGTREDERRRSWFFRHIREEYHTTNRRQFPHQNHQTYDHHLEASVEESTWCIRNFDKSNVTTFEV